LAEFAREGGGGRKHKRRSSSGQNLGESGADGKNVDGENDRSL